MQSKFPLMMLLSATLALSACLIEEPNTSRTTEGSDPQDPADPPDPPALTNNAPTISGAPTKNILEGEPYEFTPTASDADGDTLEFTVSRKPAWASFDRATGRLAGTPTAEDVGNFTNIGISVSDGNDAATLPNFDITVNQIALGSATLSWTPPTANVDGSALTDLAGYKVYYGRSSSTLDQTVSVNNPGLTRYVVENLSPAKWYFSMTSVNSRGIESLRSGTASKTIT
ncbi:MAG: putative Ig domain-containing protein [Steroidobacteraceae bacterium]